MTASVSFSFASREKSMVHKNLERVLQDLQEAKEKCDELRASKQVRILWKLK